ncbi:hypothetical protein ACKTEK_03195 [Tepidamorphus sp. 3E244]|uniref:hypothetical protein n=1 Tax=Tepidamorphus sp. 3E244 TaxID=3385498 RepID=UPI0038FCA8CB
MTTHIAAFSLGAAVAAIAVALYVSGSFRPPPEIFAGIDGPMGEERYGREATAILRKRVPIGSDVSILHDLLQAQGFKPYWSDTTGMQAGYLHGLCGALWSVNWVVSGDRKIEQLDVAYSNACA